MTRALLSLAISVLCLGMGLASAHVQAENHARAARLDALKQRCDLLEAGNERLHYRIQLRLAEIERAERLGEPQPEEVPER